MIEVSYIRKFSNLPVFSGSLYISVRWWRFASRSCWGNGIGVWGCGGFLGG
jgi:hypothetical protein